MQEEKSRLKTLLAHLPKSKQVELEVISDIILRYIEAAEMIILFGSYARGKGVKHRYKKRGTIYAYDSDFDILVVTKNRMYDVSRRWERIEEAIDRNPALSETRTVIISHDIKFLNKQIRDNYYFFVDIAKEGIPLYDSGNYQLDVPQKLSPKKRRKKAVDYFEYWFKKAGEFYDSYLFNLEKGRYNTAAFLLHQAAEYYYATFLLVFTDYRPKTHDLKDLCDRAIKVNDALKEVFPRQSQEEQHIFKLLRKAYVDARYNKDYKITPEELTYLHGRVLLLREFVEQLCQEEISRLTQACEPTAS